MCVCVCVCVGTLTFRKNDILTFSAKPLTNFDCTNCKHLKMSVVVVSDSLGILQT